MDTITILNYLLKIILFFYSDSVLPRKVVDDVILLFKCFVVNVLFPQLKVDLIQACGDNFTNKINEVFRPYERVFDYVDTEKKIFALLREKRGLIEYEEKYVGTTLEPKIVNNQEVFVSKKVYMLYVRLTDSLKFFFKIPGMFSKINNYLNKLYADSSGIISNIVQTELWEKMRGDFSGILIPLYVYFDEFEGGNALGSHAGVNKFGALYTLIGCLPPDISSQLTSIIFTGLICSKDMSACSNEDVFQYLIKELNYLRTNGIPIFVDNKPIRLYFQLVLVLGDNLGVNDMFDFVTSFKDSPFCRACSATSDIWKIQPTERKDLLRTPQNYRLDLLKNSPKDTGLKSNSVFNKVRNFHVSTNVAFDVMHDFLHGVANYVLRGIINKFIFEKGYFTVQTLNSRITSFDFGPNKELNPPPVIYINHLKNKLSIKCSAAEMLTLIRFFGIIIGDLIKDPDDEYWALYKILRKILDIILSPRVIKAYVIELEQLVKELCTLYLKTFGNLKPKFHILTHYATYMLKNGPLVNFWTMRCENRHRPLKAVVNCVSSSVNLLKSIATKETLKMCNMLHGFTVETNSDNVDYDRQDMHRKFYKDIKINGSIYKKDLVVVVDNSDILKLFGEIIDIFEENNKVKFKINQYREVYFDDHVQAYVLDQNDSEEIIVNFNDLPNMPPCYSVKSRCFYVIPHFKL